MLSIIVPVYNAEKYLKESLETLVNQTYEDKEIILVDDEAKDNSGVICDQYAEKYSFVRVIHKKNEGVQKARNTGLEAAKGNYIAFVDCDDALDLDFYEIVIKAMERTGSDVGVCGFQTEYSSNMHICKKHDDIPGEVIIDGSENILACVMGGGETNIAAFVWNKVFKRSVIGDIRFRPEITICDDLFFTLETMKNTQHVALVQTPMYHYRYVASSMSKSGSIKRFENCLDGLEVLNEWVKKNAPNCLEDAYQNYIFWNTKTCEQMLKNKNERVFRKVQKNIESCKEYIDKCSTRMRLISKAILKSWTAYRIVGGGILEIKESIYSYC